MILTREGTVWRVSPIRPLLCHAAASSHLLESPRAAGGGLSDALWTAFGAAWPLSTFLRGVRLWVRGV